MEKYAKPEMEVMEFECVTVSVSGDGTSNGNNEDNTGLGGTIW